MAFIEAQHPRDRKGRFTSKGRGVARSAKSASGTKVDVQAGPERGLKLPGTGRVTVRASLSSATVTYGRTLPLIPGRVNVHLGVLARVEKAGNAPNFLEKATDRAIEAVAGRLPNNRAGNTVADVLRGKKTDIGGLTVGGNRRRRNPTIRASSKKATAGRRVRQPRTPRQRRQT